MTRRIGWWAGSLMVMLAVTSARAQEWNPVRRVPIAIGPEASRIIVGFKVTSSNAMVTSIAAHAHVQARRLVQARTWPRDAIALAGRAGIAVATTRQLTPSMHLLVLPHTLYGTAVARALAKLRADPAVAFASVDHRRFALQAVTPNDPLFPATGTTVCTSAQGCTPTQTYSNGQWYLRAPPSTATPTDNDLAATDAVDAWAVTTGSAGIVIADVDTGVLFDHPDLGRAGFGGRLLPGYDFVGQDYSTGNNNASQTGPLGTYLVANDGDGWDPDPSDPGDWVSQTDFSYLDQYGNNLFPQATCGQPGTTSGTYLPVDSSWHGTRVSGILGALTNNAAGIAGMTWGPWLLPVRALGKCGGYDSDIIAGIEWAAGLPVTDPQGNAVPSNPYPASIVNLSLGGSGTCPASYQSALTQVTGLGVLVVASAGNGGNPGSTAPVDAPANCSALVPGVVAVAGLRNVGTKVGYSNSGPEVTLSAPAGNCVEYDPTNPSAVFPCLRSIDTTVNSGTTTPDPNGNTYTDQSNPNLGTSFSAPIVAGIAALMRSVNENLTPVQLAARLAASATPFPPNTGNLPVCPSSDPTTGECSCPPSGQCGSGMANALAAVDAAERPIAAVKLPSGGSTLFDATGSTAACGRTITSYSWTATGGVVINGSADSPLVSAIGTSGTLMLVVTDSSGLTDSATINFSASGPTISALSAAGAALAGSSSCPDPIVFATAAPTVAASLVVNPQIVDINSPAMLTLSFDNTDSTSVTGLEFTFTLPMGVAIPAGSSIHETSACSSGSLTMTSSSVTVSGLAISPKMVCGFQFPVESSLAGSYDIPLPNNLLVVGSGSTVSGAKVTLMVGLPHLQFSSNPSSITLGQSSSLTWSSTNATSCNASGGWSGAEPINGSVSVTPSTSGSMLYVLTCSGATGSITASTQIGVIASHGGGGALGWAELLGLGALGVAARRRRRA